MISLMMWFSTRHQIYVIKVDWYVEETLKRNDDETKRDYKTQILITLFFFSFQKVINSV